MNEGKAALARIVENMDAGVTEYPWRLSIYQSGTVSVAMEQWPDPDNRFGSGYLAAHISLYNVQGGPDGLDSRRYRNGKHIEQCQPSAIRSIAAYVAELEAEVARLQRRAK